MTRTTNYTPAQQALWANEIQHRCLVEAGDDVDAGIAAAEYIINNNLSIHISAFFAHDIANHRAQSILNHSLAATKELSRTARKDLTTAMKQGPINSGIAILEFIDKYRIELAKLLQTTQLAAVLEGASEVANKVPQLDVDATAVAALVGDIPQPTFQGHPVLSTTGVAFSVVNDIIDWTWRAAKVLASKNVLTRHRYDALNAQARAKSFTIAGVEAQDTLTKIRDVMAENVRQGTDYATFKQEVLHAVDTGTFLSEGHLETVFRANVQSAFSDGQMTVLQNPLVRSGFPYAAYDSIHDDRVRDEHKALDTAGIGGTNVYRSDDPVFQMFRPPWDFNCRCSWTPITIRQASEAGVKEAQTWLETGVEPTQPTFVQPPPFTPPPGFERAITSAPLSIRLSLQPMIMFSIKKSNELEDETYATSLYGQSADAGSTTSAALDTAREPPSGKRSTSVERKPKHHIKVSKKKKQALSAKSNRSRIKKQWIPTNIPLGMVDNEWHGPTPPESGNWIATAPGPKGGKRWIQSKSSQTSEGTGGKRGRSGDPSIGARGRGDDDRSATTSKPVAGKTPRSSVAQADRDEEGADKSPHTQATGDTQPRLTTPTNNLTSRPASQKAVITAINKGIKRYTEYFRIKGRSEVVEWFNTLKEHINEIGVDESLHLLGEDKSTQLNTTDTPEKVQYKGTGYFDEPSKYTDFLKDYLNRSGIVLQTGNIPDPKLRTISSAPVPETLDHAKTGDIIARATNVADKLEESKSILGLESSEDIHKIVGATVTQFTPEVLSKLDETYGKGKWIVKSYGDEAYAGFGVFFPQRLTEIQQSSKKSLWNTNKKLKDYGYKLSRDESGTVIGIANTNTNEVYKFNSNEFNNIQNKTIKKLGRVASASAPQEKGARLPTTAEQNVQQDYGILLRRDPAGKKIIGITDDSGNNVDFGSPKYELISSYITDDINRAVDAVESGNASDSRFMVQPAYEAIGVTEEDRALGLTWETSTEGRVHVTTSNGKVSVVPYATLAGRKDAFPVVFANDDIRAMEKAVEEAINALPESERAGQTYAPDVMKTKDGWRVLELNASVEGGQSLWLEENPFVIDAYVSHVTGREPAHARFIRGLLTDNVIESRAKRVSTTHHSTRKTKGGFLGGKKGGDSL